MNFKNVVASLNVSSIERTEYIHVAEKLDVKHRYNFHVLENRISTAFTIQVTISSCLSNSRIRILFRGDENLDYRHLFVEVFR